jgi:hypothetical protein
MKYAGSGVPEAAGLDLKRSNNDWQAVVTSAPVAETASRTLDRERVVEARQAVANVANRTKRTGGKIFVQNGTQWVDTRAQASPREKVRRIQFDSDAYYELLASRPESAQWLALGRNMLIVYNDELIEIYE